MDIESRLQKIETQVHQIKTLVWILLALVLAFGFGLLPTYVPSLLVILTLMAMAYLLYVVVSGWWQIRTSREADAQVFRQAIAERTQDQSQDPGL